MTLPEFTLNHLLLNSASARPQADAIVDGDRAYSYSELLAESQKLAGALRENGVRRGDRVGVDRKSVV